MARKKQIAQPARTGQAAQVRCPGRPQLAAEPQFFGLRVQVRTNALADKAFNVGRWGTVQHFLVECGKRLAMPL